MRSEIDEVLKAEIDRHCVDGNRLADEGDHEAAFKEFLKALNLVPEPKEMWEATTWIIAAIGDQWFLRGKIERALDAFQDAVRCPGGLGNPFIHLRLGECQFELGNLNKAADELMRAYMGAGPEIFKEEKPGYLEFLSSYVKERGGSL